jgi:hypothetical protein
MEERQTGLCGLVLQAKEQEIEENKSSGDMFYFFLFAWWYTTICFLSIGNE